MKILLFVCGMLALVGCGKTTPEFVSHIEANDSDSGKIWTLAKPGADKRILLIHGLTVDHTTFYDGPPALLVNYLWKSGWQVMFIDLPLTLDQTALKATLDQNYGPNFQDRIRKVIAFGDQKWGHVDKLMVGGISWGGLHALMAAAKNPEFTGYMTFIPVVDIKALDGYAPYELSNFCPPSEVSNLAKVSGYLVYGGQDAAVDPQQVGGFVNQLYDVGADLTSDFFPTYRHELTYKMFKQAIAWLDQQKGN